MDITRHPWTLSAGSCEKEVALRYLWRWGGAPASAPHRLAPQGIGQGQGVMEVPADAHGVGVKVAAWRSAQAGAGHGLLYR